MNTVNRPQSIIGNLSSMYTKELYPNEFNLIDLRDWISRGQNTHIVAQREMLEKFDLVRQAQMYNVLVRHTPEGYEYLVYLRTPAGAEPSLHDKYSIGWGGHTDLAMAIFDAKTSVLNFGATMFNALEIEMDEELKITLDDEPATLIDAFYSKIETALLLQDTKPEIFHAGIVNIIEVRDGFEFAANEPDITMIGWRTAEQMKEQFGDKIESWSKLILANEHEYAGKVLYLDKNRLENLNPLEAYTHYLEQMLNMSVEYPAEAINTWGSRAGRDILRVSQTIELNEKTVTTGEPKRSNTLAEYFANSPVIDHSLRATTIAGVTRFYIHPASADGETMDFEVDGNFVHPTQREQVIGNEQAGLLNFARGQYENIGPSEAEVEIHVYSRVRQIGRARIAHVIKNALTALGYNNVGFASDPRVPATYLEQLDFSHLDSAEANKRSGLKITIHKFR